MLIRIILSAMHIVNRFVLLPYQDSVNFINSLYPGGLSIVCFPFLQDLEFYMQLDEVVGAKVTCQDQIYQTAFQKSGLMKTLLAKIGHKDWSVW